MERAKKIQPRNTGIGHRIGRLMAAGMFFSVFIAALGQALIQAMGDIEERHAQVETAAFILAASSADAVATKNQQLAMLSLRAIARVPNIKMATLQSNDGTTIASMGQATYLTETMLTAADSNVAILFKKTMPVSVDIMKGGKTVGRVVTVADISDLQSQTLYTMFTTFAVALLAAFFGVLLSKPLQRRIVKPLTDLTVTIQNIRKSREYIEIAQCDGQTGESAILLTAFNGLMGDVRARDVALKQLAYHDPLTGLPNRVSFQRSLESWLARPHERLAGAVVLFNIHGFRALNDAFSHSIGDAILLTVAAQIKATLRDDSIVARYGGDEFAVLFKVPDSRSELEMCIARVQAAFFKPVVIDALKLHVTLTAGAVMMFEDHQHPCLPDEILRHADLALAEAKSKSAGTAQIYHPDLSAHVQWQTDLGQALRQAADADLFSVHYQAQFDCIENRITGFEALARWTHPTFGNVSPAQFIPLAERLGIINQIGDFVMRESVRQLCSWRKAGAPERTVSVNVSPAQILQVGFADRVLNLLRQQNLPPQLLCLELTESIFLGDKYSETNLVLQDLRRAGIILALDDFGTGYSSLGYLSKLPFHVIKVDRSFVTKVDTSERRAGILKSVIDMAHTLDMKIVAEGAETPQEMALLAKFGVEKVQGYVIARPSPADDAFARAAEIEARYQVPVLARTA